MAAHSSLTAALAKFTLVGVIQMAFVSHAGPRVPRWEHRTVHDTTVDKICMDPGHRAQSPAAGGSVCYGPAEPVISSALRSVAIWIAG